MSRQLAAWIVLGPVGHLAGGVSDWLALMTRWQLSRLRESCQRDASLTVD